MPIRPEQAMPNDKFKKLIRDRQMQYINDIQDHNLNIVTCGNCGAVFISLLSDEIYICPHCLVGMDASDCPDLFYEGMEWPV